MTGDQQLPSLPTSLPQSRAAGHRSLELNNLVRNWRGRLDPATFPGLAGSRKKRRLSQEDVAHFAGTSSFWYGTLERGMVDSNYSDDFLDRVAYTLRLTPDERRALYLLAVEREPSPQVVRSPPGINEVVRRVVDQQPWPAYISDENWDFVAHNDHLASWFPWVQYKINIMWWVFTYPDARRQLYDWEGTWAPTMLAQMRMASAVDQENTYLATLIERILRANAFARDLWESHVTVHQHPDGDRRQLLIPPDDTLQTVEIVASTLFRAPTTRLIVLVPIDE